MPKFVCSCGNDTFRCNAEVHGYVDAEVRTTKDGELEKTYVATNGEFTESLYGPFICMECDAEYDDIPPEGWAGWEPEEMRLTPAQRIARGELPLIPNIEAR